MLMQNAFGVDTKMKSKIKEKVLKKLDLKKLWEEDTMVELDELKQAIDLTIQETSKHYEKKIKELEKEIKLTKASSGDLLEILKLQEEIKQLKKQLKEQPKKIFDDIDEIINQIKMHHPFHYLLSINDYNKLKKKWFK